MSVKDNLYRHLGRLIEAMPNLRSGDVTSSEVTQWLGRTYALIKETVDINDQFDFKTSINKLNSIYPLEKSAAVTSIHLVIYRALAIAELAAPPGTDGTFIPVGNSFDAFAAISKILGKATSDVLIIDPYMDEVVLTDFCLALPEGVNLRLMADLSDHKATLIPAAERWVSQFKETRPLNVHLAPSRTLHDRAILIDKSIAYTLTQSFNAFAKRSPAEIVRADDTAKLKIIAYEQIWTQAKSIFNS